MRSHLEKGSHFIEIKQVNNALFFIVRALFDLLGSVLDIAKNKFSFCLPFHVENLFLLRKSTKKKKLHAQVGIFSARHIPLGKTNKFLLAATLCLLLLTL